MYTTKVVKCATHRVARVRWVAEVDQCTSLGKPSQLPVPHMGRCHVKQNNFTKAFLVRVAFASPSTYNPTKCFVSFSFAIFRLREKNTISAWEAAKRSRNELEDGEENAQMDLVSVWEIFLGKDACAIKSRPLEHHHAQHRSLVPSATLFGVNSSRCMHETPPTSYTPLLRCLSHESTF